MCVKESAQAQAMKWRDAILGRNCGSVKCSSLAGPIGVRDGAPSRADRFVFIGRERACRCVADILCDALDSRRADDRGADAGGAECEPERRCDGGLGVAAEKIVAEFLQAIPIWLPVPI